MTLDFFFTGIAILSIEVENINDKEYEDILNINEFGRRVYPPFLDKKVGIEKPKELFLADKITIDGFSETFENYPKKYMTGHHIMGVLGENFKEYKDANSFFIEPLLDDRMFLLSWYGEDELVASIAKDEESMFGSKEESDQLSSDKWYKYLFVDTTYPSIQNDLMKKEELENATYKRWQKYHTLYGISYYSFVALTKNDEFGKEEIAKHMGGLYKSIMLIVLATRASIKMFTDEIVTNRNLSDGSFSLLYEKYLLFNSKLNLKEITHQQQGIELYNLARKQMRIEEEQESLEKKFTTLFALSNFKSDEVNSKSMDKLTLLGAIFLPPSLMVAILSIGIFDYNNTDNIAGWVFGSIGATVLMGIFSIKKMFQTKTMAWLYGVLFAIIVLLSYSNIKAHHEERAMKVKVENKILRVKVQE